MNGPQPFGEGTNEGRNRPSFIEAEPPASTAGGFTYNEGRNRPSFIEARTGVGMAISLPATRVGTDPPSLRR